MLKRLRLINVNVLKIIGAVSMFIDHMGMMLFPQILIFRIIGRLAFPLFAFTIAQGCYHTKSKLRHFMSVAILAAVCEIGYSFYSNDNFLCVLVTFSISIALVYALQLFKELMFFKRSVAIRVIGAGAIFVCGVTFAYLFNLNSRVEYGFFGCMLPVFASLFQMPQGAPEHLKKLDVPPVHALSMAVGMLFICIGSDPIQYFSFLALPLIFLYSGKRGKLNLKYFFYIFYPVHLVVLAGIAILIHIL